MRIGRFWTGALTAFVASRLGSATLDLGLDNVDERIDGDASGLRDFVEYLHSLRAEPEAAPSQARRIRAAA